MTANSRGKKHFCKSCSISFYDLNKSPISCPKCGKSPDESDKKSSKKKNISTEKKLEEASIPKDLEDDLDLVDVSIEDEDMEDVMEDVSLEEKEKTDDL